MKGFNIFVVMLLLFVHCKPKTSQSNSQAESQDLSETTSFGIDFDTTDVYLAAEMAHSFQELAENDTISTSFKGKVSSVCKTMGCWLKVDMGNDQEIMVKFKSEAFTVPSDIIGKEVLIHGLGFKETISVEDQKHYAKDAQVDNDSLQKIANPSISYSFLADGVKIQE